MCMFVSGRMMTLYHLQYFIIHFQLLFTDFTSLAGSCDQDYLLIYNGGLATSPVIGKYCAGTRPDSFLISQSNQLRVQFHSDDSSTTPGFRLQYEFSSAGTDYLGPT